MNPVYKSLSDTTQGTICTVNCISSQSHALVKLESQLLGQGAQDFLVCVIYSCITAQVYRAQDPFTSHDSFQYQL